MENQPLAITLAIVPLELSANQTLEREAPQAQPEPSLEAMRR
jgi:hypothetical protein